MRLRKQKPYLKVIFFNAQLSIEIIMIINVKMTNIVGILKFIS